MSQSPTVSVIIPAYNAAKFLEETVHSVLASSYPIVEIVIVNDGSTDNTQKVAESLVSKYSGIKAIYQENRGATVARNTGIAGATGKYILPLDADDLIVPHYIEKAVEILEERPDVKVVQGMGEFFGDRRGKWNLKPFSLKLLARKNMLHVSGMYRKADFEKTDGYCPEIKGREDWDFWISLLKRGGNVVRIPEVCLYYRIHANSKRKASQHRKKELIRILNKRHKAFFYRQLGGPLHFRRTWSRFFNFFIRLVKPERVFVNPQFQELDEFVYSLPDFFMKEGTYIHSGRNTLKMFLAKESEIIVKSFIKPNVLNRLIYGNFRTSKAQRSYQYAQKLLDLGIATPVPVGFYQNKCLLLFSESYFASLKSECKHCFMHLMQDKTFQNRTEILKEIGRYTAKLHQNGILHADYSAGNILFRTTDNKVIVEIVDLNRLRFKKVDIRSGCENFERLNTDDESLAIMATAYAEARGFDVPTCIRYVQEMRWHKHKNIRIN